MAVTVISDTLNASQLPVMVDVDFFDYKTGCPSGWSSIFDVYWPGVHQSCVQNGELRRRDQAAKRKNEDEVRCDE